MASALPDRLRIMTWNIWWRFGPQWRDRQAGIIKTLSAVDPDVVALQEVWGTDDTTQAAEFGAQLGLHSAFALTSLPPAPDPPETPDQRDVRVGLGLLSRWPITAMRPVAMPARHRPPPVNLVASLAHPTGPLNVIVTCLEWEPQFQDDQLAQARDLADLAVDTSFDGPLPVVVAGDLNAPSDSPALRILTDVLIDTWDAGHGDPRAVTLSSAHPFAPKEVPGLLDQRIDHVLVRPGNPRQQIQVDRVALAGHPVDGLDPSDHHAVTCDLRWFER